MQALYLYIDSKNKYRRHGIRLDTIDSLRRIRPTEPCHMAKPLCIIVVPPVGILWLLVIGSYMQQI